MNGLLRRLEKIRAECVVQGPGKNKANEPNLDEFTRLKNKISAELKEVRRLVKDREQLEVDAPGTVATVEVSSQIRNTMKEARADAINLQKIFEKDKADYIKRNKMTPEKDELMDVRDQTVQLVFDHIEECKLLDQKRLGTSVFSSMSSSKEPPPSSLPDIDDPEFQLLRKNDQIIDGMLDNVSAGVYQLKEMASQMGKEAEIQGDLLENLDTKVDRVNAQLENINVRLAKALKSARTADRFCVDIILLCILLGLAGYIYSIVKK